MILTFNELIELILKYGGQFRDDSIAPLTLVAVSDCYGEAKQLNVSRQIDYLTSQGHSLRLYLSDDDKIAKIEINDIVANDSIAGIKIGFKDFLKLMSKYGRKYFLQVHPNFELCINFSGTDNHILEVFRIYRDMEQYYFDDDKILQIQFNRAGDVRDLSISPDL